MNLLNKTAAASVAIAMTFTSMPAFAAIGVSPEAQQTYSSDGPLAEEATEYRRRHRRYRRGVRAGDVLAGIGILAGIAIIASSASKSSNRKRSSDRRDYPNQQRSSGGVGGDELSTAVSACSNAAERSAGEGARVEEIRSAARDGNGWRVSGILNDTRGFDCGTSNGGIDFIQLGDARGAI